MKEEKGRMENFVFHQFWGFTTKWLNVNSPGWSGAEPRVAYAGSSPSAVACTKQCMVRIPVPELVEGRTEGTNIEN